MTDAWDERTEAIPGLKDDKSFDLDLEFVEPPETASVAATGPIPIVVFEPAPIGLATALARLGFAVTSGSTGVDVMSVVAAGIGGGNGPAAVLCAPAPDAERRRLLAAALRLRFPQVPIVYVSTHAAQADAVVGAMREGARGVLPWPLPARGALLAALEPMLGGDGPPTDQQRKPEVRTDTAPTPRLDRDEQTGVRGRPKPPASTDDAFGDAETLVTDAGTAPHPLSPPAPPAPPAAPMPVPIEFPEGPATQPNLRPAAVAASEALAQKRGEIGALLSAVSPFLWSLEDAARWAKELGEAGDASAATHARTLALLAKILAQLQARIDDLGA